MKIDHHKTSNTEQRFIELQEMENKKKELEIDIDKMKIDVRSKLDKIEKLATQKGLLKNNNFLCSTLYNIYIQ